MEGVKTTGVRIAACLVVVSVVLHLLKRFNDWWFVRSVGPVPAGSKLPPGSAGWPLLGEMLDFLWCFKFARKPDDFIANRRLRYGDTGIYRTHLFGYPTIVTCSPELNKQILGSRTEDGSFGPGWPTSELLGNSVTAFEGFRHKKLRRHLAEAFNNPRALDSHLTSAQPLVISTLEDWAAKRKIIAYEETKAMTFRNICDSLVSFKSEELLERMESMYRGLMAGLRSMTINIPGTAYHHALRCRRKLNDILLNEYKERAAGGNHKHDFMQNLMDSVDENGNKLDGTEIVDNIVTLILGGYESTSNVMTWALYYLAKYPEVLEKLKDEIKSIQKQKSDGEQLLNLADIKRMKYTEKVAEELIRLSNVSPFIFRRVAKDDVVVNGFKFPKNWKVLVWIRSIHIDSKYFADPLTFNPDRWEDFKPKAGTYSVFGAGPRLCPGNNFARVQVMMFLYHASLKYRWQLVNPDSGMAFQPNPKPSDGGELIFERAF